MNRHFVPYKIGLKLKDLGFDMACLASYSKEDEFNFTTGSYMYKVTPSEPEFCIVPLWQQAFQWFRERHNLMGVPDYDETTKKYYYFINTMDSGEVNFSKDYPSFDEAQLACLEKLIEYVKSAEHE